MKLKKVLSIVLSLGLGAGLLYVILRQVNMDILKLSLKSLNIWWIVSAVMLYTVDMLIRAYKWREMLKDNGICISIRESFFAYNLGNTMNIVIPAKIGDIARSYYLKKKYGNGYSSTLPSIFLDRILDVLGGYIVLLVSSLYVLGAVNMPQWFYSLIIIGVICLIAVFIVMAYMVKNREKVKSIKNTNVKNLVSAFIDVLEGSVKNRIKFVKLIVYTSISWLCDGLIAFLVFLALGQKVSPFAVVFAAMVATLTKVFPVTPGGIGVFEGTMVIIFSLFGFKSDLTGIISTLSHFLMNLYTLCIGVYVLIKNGISVSDIRMEKVKEK